MLIFIYKYVDLAEGALIIISFPVFFSLKTRSVTTFNFHLKPKTEMVIKRALSNQLDKSLLVSSFGAFVVHLEVGLGSVLATE